MKAQSLNRYHLQNEHLLVPTDQFQRGQDGQLNHLIVHLWAHEKPHEVRPYAGQHRFMNVEVSSAWSATALASVTCCHHQ